MTFAAPACRFRASECHNIIQGSIVKMKHPEIEHMVCVQDFEYWLGANPRLPAEMVLKNRLPKLLR